MIAIGVCLPLLAKVPLQDIQVTTTDHAELAAGGTVRVTGSTGEMDVEGWDKSEVEITVTKSVFRTGSPRGKEAGNQFLSRVQVKTERTGNGEVDIRTVFPSWNPITRPLRGKTDVNLHYTIRVPRDAHLVIHHESGDLRLQGLTGPIEATMGAGDIELWLPQASKYAIDARCKIGGVSSDFAGSHHDRHVVGESFANESAGGPKAYLRVDAGGIQILKTSDDGK